MPKPSADEQFAAAFRLFADRRFADARAAAERALKADRYHPNATHLLARIDVNDRRYAQAADQARRAIRFRPTDPSIHNTLSVALLSLGDAAGALDAARAAVQLDPTASPAHATLARALKGLNRLNEAVRSAEDAVRLDPSNADAHRALANSLLLLGDYDRGWQEYEWRTTAQWVATKFGGGTTRRIWDGRRVDTLVVHSEQGLGDTIHFARYLPTIASMVGKIIVTCDAHLFGLMRQNFPDVDFVDRYKNEPSGDAHIAIMSLARVLRATPSVTTSPYLAADGARSDEFRALIGDASQGLRVGLVWAGNPDNRNDALRSMLLTDLAPLLAVDGTRFFSLQKGPAAKSLETPSELTARIRDLGPELRDFTDTAAAIESLDLVISVDTAPAHLAGALHRPVWTLLPFAHDWRWLLDRSDSPWYPTMTLFRQAEDRQWAGVINRTADALRTLAYRP